MRARLPTTLIYPFSHPHLTPHLLHPPLHSRPLTSTPPLSKKPNSQSPKHFLPPHPGSSTQDTPLQDPSTIDLTQTLPPTHALRKYDFGDYNAAIARAHEHLRAELGKIKAGGRRNADEIEGLRVVLKGEGGGGKGKAGREKEKERGGVGGGVVLGDVASVVVRGRNIAVLVGEKEHLKPILSSLATLPSLTPTASPTDPLTLTIAIPPVTTESRLLAKQQATKKGEEALSALREARGAQRKRNRSKVVKRVMGPDEMRKVEREMEKVNEGAVREAKALVEGCKRGLEGG